MTPATPAGGEGAQRPPQAMDVRYINPFIGSVEQVFGTLLGAWVRRGAVSLQRGTVGDDQLTAIIGLSGAVRGVVTAVLPAATAMAIVSAMLGETYTEVSADVVDGVAELANLVAGGAKSQLVESDAAPIQLGLPSVVTGSRFAVLYPPDAAWLEIAFDSQLGAFCLRVTLEAAT